MSRRKRRKSRKRLAYGVIVVVSILVCFLAYYFLHSSDQTASPEAAIVDHLSFFPEQRNQTFVDACINVLDDGELTWAYHNGTEVTVNFYRNLPSYGASLIILRVHSAIMKTENETISVLGLFTSERYSPEAAGKYPEDVNDRRLVEAYFSPEERAQGISYFGIVPEFVEKSMKGKFKETIIIMMGCEGLGYQGRTYTDMAKTFVNKGAKVYISWDGPISIDHTDQATVHLLQSLILENQTIKEAVEEISPDPKYKSTLQYYPKTAEVEDYTITSLKSSLTMNVACTSPTHRVPTRSKYTAHE